MVAFLAMGEFPSLLGTFSSFKTKEVSDGIHKRALESD